MRLRCVLVWERWRALYNGNPWLGGAPLHMALLLSGWEQLPSLSGREGWLPSVSGWGWDRLEDHLRSLFRQPLVDPCRSGGWRVSDGALAIWGHSSRCHGGVHEMAELTDLVRGWRGWSYRWHWAIQCFKTQLIQHFKRQLLLRDHHKFWICLVSCASITWLSSFQALLPRPLCFSLHAVPASAQWENPSGSLPITSRCRFPRLMSIIMKSTSSLRNGLGGSTGRSAHSF